MIEGFQKYTKSNVAHQKQGLFIHLIWIENQFFFNRV